jgi:hypothetical protein
VAREETAKAVEAEGLTIRVPVDAETAKTLRGLKPGQTFTVMNTDGSFDQVTVRGPKAPAKAPAKKHTRPVRRSSPTALETIRFMSKTDEAFRFRYSQARNVGVLDSEILLYEQTGGYKAHEKNGLQVYVSKTSNHNKVYHAIRLRNWTKRPTETNRNPHCRISFDTHQEASNSANFRIPLYHEICAEQARKMKGRKA